MPLSLERLQAEFAAALSADGVPSAALGDALIETDAHARLALYRRNVHAGWRHALALAYPVLQALVGADCFDALARRYGDAHPSTDADLNRYGADFAPFVATDAATADLPYLADVAALEWAVHRALRAADVAPLPRERIVALSAEQLLAARFALHPACAWVASAHPICSLWTAHQPEATIALSAIPQKAEFALITRRRWRATVTPITHGDLIALDAIRAGANMDDTISAALHGDRSFEFAKAFLRWLDCGVFAALHDAPAV